MKAVKTETMEIFDQGNRHDQNELEVKKLKNTYQNERIIFCLLAG